MHLSSNELKVVDLLRTGATVSGDTLRRALGIRQISAVIDRLRQKGYRIRGTRARGGGYRWLNYTAPVVVPEGRLDARLGVEAFEVGVVYRHHAHGALWLAVDPKVLFSLHHGAPVELRPYVLGRYEAQRSITVEELCRRWRIEELELDRALRRWLTPDPRGIKPRPRGSRTEAAADVTHTLVMRTHRITRAR